MYFAEVLVRILRKCTDQGQQEYQGLKPGVNIVRLRWKAVGDASLPPTAFRRGPPDETDRIRRRPAANPMPDRLRIRRGCRLALTKLPHPGVHGGVGLRCSLDGWRWVNTLPQQAANFANKSANAGGDAERRSRANSDRPSRRRML